MTLVASSALSRRRACAPAASPRLVARPNAAVIRAVRTAAVAVAVRGTAVAVTVAVAACTPSSPSPGSATAPVPANPAAPSSSSSSSPLPANPAPKSSAGAPPSKAALRFDEDVDAAMARAKSAGKVVFVDGWAPWCHTCLSMQRDVLQDPSLTAYEDRVVFAAVDTDKPEAASFVNKFPLRSWPTFFVIDPATDHALAEYAGSMSLAETTRFLDDALHTRDPAAQNDPQTRAILLGHVAMQTKDYAAAIKSYGDAAALPGARRPEAALGAMRAYGGAKDDHGCVDFGVAQLKAGMFATSSSTGDFVSYIASCADHLDAKDPKRAPAFAAARAALEPVTVTPPAGASVDDKADALATLADIAEAQGDKAAFTAAHEKRLKLLEDDAAAQKDIESARVHDYARMNSYIALGRGDEAVKLLTMRTTQLPQSYEAWARLASALHQIKRDDEAVAPAQKAIELSYGPRRLRYRTMLADIQAARKDAAAEKKAVSDLVDDAQKLPVGQKDDVALAAAQARLAKLDRPR